MDKTSTWNYEFDTTRSLFCCPVCSKQSKQLLLCLFDNWFLFRSTEIPDLKVLLPALFGINLGESETAQLIESLKFIEQKANYVSVLGQGTLYQLC